ncbi:MAG: hypothetical protein E7173_01490 [Firmicutes bacterium]|nr:hypothetical protein [Bacillota bacterium]
MREFFLNKNLSTFQFKIFNVFHLISLVITFAIFIFIIYNRPNITNISSKRKKQIRIAFGIILLLFYIVRRGSFLYYGVYNWRYHLSLGFCNMTSWLFIIYCFSGNKKIYNLCYYCAFCGPLLSIIFPVINIGINNYSFVNFLMLHHVVFLINIVFAIFEKKEYNKEDMVISYVYMICYILSTYLFNFIFGTHYNELGQLISNSIKQHELISYATKNLTIGSLILLCLETGLINVGRYILKQIKLRGGKNEK